MSPLTPREHEVATLVAAGLSTRELAECLIISERTAEHHLSHVLDKLDLTSHTYTDRDAGWLNRVAGIACGKRG